MDDGYRITSDPEEIDQRAVWRWLAEDSYWATGRSWERHQRAVDHSRNFAVLTTAGETVGFARVVTDGVTFGWLADVMVLPGHRGNSLGKALVAGVLADPELAGLDRIVLGTRDAHGLYGQYGFVPDTTNRYMERFKPIEGE
jgi:N-acetylglutamate synthase-like GNAT family acetyltransferase